MTDTAIKPCPCGEVPNRLYLVEGYTCKYAYVTGDCCSEWNIEFRTEYNNLDTPQCMTLAIAAWNESPRGTKP